MKNIRYFDIFSGVGGFRAALEQIEGTQCVGYCEIDPHAQKSYRALFQTEGEWFTDDATKINPKDMPDFDLLVGGFPCQSFSVAGKGLGFEDTRGTLFFDAARVLAEKQPPFFLLENVPNLLWHDKGKTYRTILSALSDLGYHVEWSCYNSKDFGVPQSRNRVFIAGYLDGRCAGKVLPVPGANSAALIQLIGGDWSERCQWQKKRTQVPLSVSQNHLANGFGHSEVWRQGARVYDPNGISCTLSSETGGFGGRTGLYAMGFRTQHNAAIGEAPQEDRHFIDLCAGEPKVTDKARCVTAHYGKTTLCYHKGERSGVLELLRSGQQRARCPAEDKKGASDAFLEPQGFSDRKNIIDAPPLLIKGNVRRGYHEARPGDAVTLSFPTSNERHTRVKRDIAHTLDTGCQEGVVTLSGRIRRLTPRECFRLQGFREDQIDKILAVTSDSQAYKQAGNSVTVPVVHAIARKIKAAFDEIQGGGAS